MVSKEAIESRKRLIKKNPDSPFAEDMEKKNILEDPQLFEKINSEFDKKVVREEDTRKTIFLCSCGRFVENAKMTSYNLFVNSESGAGKDYVVSKVLDIWKKCKSGYIKRTRLSPRVLNYWHNPKFEPSWTWDNKILYLEDIGDGVLNNPVFKVFTSSGSHCTVLIKQYPTDIQVQGKPVVIITTANANPEHELIRRFTIINMDETEDQSKLILDQQAEFQATGHNDNYNEEIMMALTKLERVKVKIPYATKLVPHFPSDNIIIRTYFERFCDFIKASAALYQFQRKTDNFGYILAEEQDYEIAKIALMKAISNNQMIPLTKNQQRLLKILEQFNEWMSADKIDGYVTFMNKRSLYKNLNILVRYSLVKKMTELNEKTNRDRAMYMINSKKTNFLLPKFDKLLCVLIVPDVAEIRKVKNDTNIKDNHNNIDTKDTKDTKDTYKRGKLI